MDVEAFSSSTFYHLLLQQSLSVTTQLGRLTTEVFSSDLFFFFFLIVKEKQQLQMATVASTTTQKIKLDYKHPNRGIMVHQVHHSPSSMARKRQTPNLFYLLSCILPDITIAFSAAVCGKRGCCYRPQHCCGGEDVRGDVSSRTHPSAHTPAVGGVRRVNPYRPCEGAWCHLHVAFMYSICLCISR